MPQKAIKKGDLRPREVSIEAVDSKRGYSCRCRPASIPKLWPASLTGRREKHKRVCA